MPIRSLASIFLLGLLLATFGEAQDLETRRWSHLPIGTQLGGTGYVYTEGEIAFDPVLLIEDAEVEMHTAVVRYLYVFECLDRQARFDFVQGHQQARWSGLLNGAPAATSRVGFSDTVLRFSMNLCGSPPLEGEEFREYRKTAGSSETIVGAGLAVHLPTGHYLEDRLLNLGSNRFTFRPQLGVVHRRGKVAVEVTGSGWFFTDNDEFWNGNHLEHDPLATVQGHCVYTLRPGLWVSAGAAWARGARSTLNGVQKNDRKTNVGLGVAVRVPITPKMGLKLGYTGLQTRESVGADLDNYLAAISLVW